MRYISNRCKFLDGFHQKELKLPFEGHGDEVIHRWIKSIEGIECRKVNEVWEYYSLQRLIRNGEKSKPTNRSTANQLKPFEAKKTPQNQKRNPFNKSQQAARDHFNVVSFLTS